MLNERNLFNSYVNIEMPVLQLFGDMELNGFTIDICYLKKSIKEWTSLCNALDNKLKAHNDGEAVNPRSSLQVHNLLEKNGLYDKYVEQYGLPEGVSIETLKTGKDILEKMKDLDELPSCILDMRKLYHLISAAETIETEIVNSTKCMGIFKHFIATGRIAMHDPNLLGIDKNDSINIDGEEFALNLKRSFKARSGFTLICADYSQIELRFLAALANDANLKKIFNEAKDPFKQIAAKIKKKQEADEITLSERSSAKQIIYSIIYGCGIRRLASNLNVSEEIAREFLNEFHATFPALKEFIKQCKQFARENGYAETLFSRRRILGEINSEDERLRSADERKAVNSRIQGSAADLVKLSMLKVNKAIDEDEKIEAEILLQVHDELIYAVKDDEYVKKRFIDLLVKEMTSCSSVLDVKLQIKVQEGMCFACDLF